MIDIMVPWSFVLFFSILHEFDWLAEWPIFLIFSTSRK